MNNEQRLIFLLHGLVRSALASRPVDEAYLAVCKSVFPGVVLGQSGIAAAKVKPDYLPAICDFIYELDDKEVSYASCYSASIVIQLIALAHGIDSEIVIGIKRQDEKIVGHAWVETIGIRPKQIITPGRSPIDDFKVVKRLHPEKSIQSWIKRHAILDAAHEP